MNWTNILYSLLLSSFFMVALWQNFDARVIFIFALSLIGAESFIQLRWRLSLPCPHCAFDPVLYLRDPKQAAQRVKDFIEEKKSRSDFYIRKSPLRDLPRRTNDLEKGRHLSKRL